MNENFYNENSHEDTFVTIQTNRAGDEIVQRGQNTCAIRIVYPAIQTYRMMAYGHMLIYNEEQDTFMSGGHYYHYSQLWTTLRHLRPDPETFNPETEAELRPSFRERIQDVLTY